MSKAKEVTQRLTAHLNGGKAWAGYTYNIEYKGTVIGEKAVNLGPKPARKTQEAKVFCGDKVFDLMTAQPGELEAFLNQRIEEMGL